MSTHLITSDGTSHFNGCTPAPSPRHGSLKYKPWLWFALPLVGVIGCASSPNRSAVAYNNPPAPIVAPFAQPQATNVVIGREILDMFVSDKSFDYALRASDNNQGVVTLYGTSSDRVERQRMVDQTWELAGVNEVTDNLGVETPETVGHKAVAAR